MLYVITYPCDLIRAVQLNLLLRPKTGFYIQQFNVDVFYTHALIPMLVYLGQCSWGQHGAHLGPTGPRLAPCWPHELCYLGWRAPKVSLRGILFSRVKRYYSYFDKHCVRNDITKLIFNTNTTTDWPLWEHPPWIFNLTKTHFGSSPSVPKKLPELNHPRWPQGTYRLLIPFHNGKRWYARYITTVWLHS